MKANFSIIVPTLNSEKFVERLLFSLVDQSLSEFEIIIMDGKSSDKSLKIINSFRDKRIKIDSAFDNGVYDAMNNGLAKASGEWVYFIGADDWLYNHTVLERIYEKLKETKCHVAYGNVLIQGDSDWAKDQEIYAGKFDAFRLTKKNICHQGIFYRRSFLESHNLNFDLAYPINSDWDFNLKCRTKTDFHYLELIVANFSSGGLSTNSRKKDNFFSEIPWKYQEFQPSKARIISSKFINYFKIKFL